MRRFLRFYALLTLLSSMTGCAAGTQGGPERSQSSRAPISIEEIQSLPTQYTAHDAVQRLRPRWMRPRGPASFAGTAPVVVFMDNVRVGGLDFLTSIPLERVSEIRYFDASDATNRWGTGLAGGAIEVITARGR
jgi:hypothetical protein